MTQALDILHQVTTLRVKHLAGQHDQRAHAGSKARPKGPIQGRLLNVYKRPEDFVLMTESELRWTFGNTKEPWLKDAHQPASIIQGELVEYKDLPEMLYHVTTRASDVEKSGVLMGHAGLSSGGLGGHSTEGVSLTSSKRDAENIQRQMRRVIELSKSDEDLRSVFTNWAREDEKISGLDAGTLEGSVDAAVRNYEVNMQAPVYQENPDAAKRLRVEVARAYRTFAEGKGAPPDVIIFGSDFSNLNPEDVQTFEIPKSAAFASGGAVLRNVAPGDFLHEVRVYGDVPMDEARIIE